MFILHSPCCDHHGDDKRQISRNMFSLTLRFIATGLPFSYSIPATPPSPDMLSSFSRSLSSA